ncbi:MAG: DsrE family protein [Spirochaetales bacterium]|nr:DsrE family protein [Spirochaetales bacterium]
MNSKLNILWTNADPVTAELMVMMYARNSLARGWWESVQIIIWGATTKLIAENETIRKKLLELQSNGIEINACLVCAEELGVADKLKESGISVKKMGLPLTEILKSEEKLITV